MLGRVNDAMAYVETNPCGEIDPGRVAAIACVSHGSFERFFSYRIGMSLAEYIRRRRLTLAAFELREPGARVLDPAGTYKVLLPVEKA